MVNTRGMCTQTEAQLQTEWLENAAGGTIQLLPSLQSSTVGWLENC